EDDDTVRPRLEAVGAGARAPLSGDADETVLSLRADIPCGERLRRRTDIPVRPGWIPRDGQECPPYGEVERWKGGTLERKVERWKGVEEHFAGVRPVCQNGC